MLRLVSFLGAIPIFLLCTGPADAGCGLVAADGKEIHQTAQKVFLHWDPKKNVEVLVLEPAFESKVADFGMVIPTPSKPEIGKVPREFFMDLDVFTTLARRTYPISRLKDPPPEVEGPRRAVKVKVLAEGIVGTRSYQVVTSEKTDELMKWLKENHAENALRREALDFYVKKKWCFTLLKNDPAQMRKQGDGAFAGEVSPICLTFASPQPIYPLRAARLGVKDQLDVLFYVQAPSKMDLPGEATFQFQWVPLLLNSRGVAKGYFGEGDLPGKIDDWLKAINPQAPALVKKGQELGFAFTNKVRPRPNKKGRIATTLEWARRLTADDFRILTGKAPYGEQVSDPDEGFTVADVKNDRRREAIFKVIQRRMARTQREHPTGFLARSAPPEDVARLKELTGRLQVGQFLVKIRKVFTQEEIDEDIVLVPARVAGLEDVTEYTEVLPASPP